METLCVKLNIIDTGYKTMPVAKRTTSEMYLNGKSVSLSAFNIDGYNYVRLRDLAPVLNGSAKQFEMKRVDFEDTTYITSGVPFTISDIKLPIGTGDEKTALPFSVRTDIDGREIIFDSYLLDGFNFIKLRDIAIALDFSVLWDGAQNRITINTTQSYAE